MSLRAKAQNDMLSAQLEPESERCNLQKGPRRLICMEILATFRVKIVNIHVKHL